jgi:hypothetical protein
MMLIIEDNKTIYYLKIFIGFVLTLFFFGFSAANTAFAQLCFEPPSIRAAPTETKMVGDVMVDYFTRPRANVQLTYENAIFKRKTKSNCHNMELRIRFFNYGNKPRIPESVELTLWSVSSALKYVNARSWQFKILADESEIYSVELDRDFTEYKKNQSYSETLGTEFSFSVLEKMAKAEKISFMLGKSSIEMTAKDLRAIKQIVDLAKAND